MDTLKLQKNRGYVIAGMGGIVAFIAFFLPYVSTPVAALSLSGSQVTQFQGLLWLELLVAIAAIVVAALLIYRSNPFGMATTPVEKQIRWGIYGLIGAGALGVLMQIIFAIGLNSISFMGVSITSVGVGLGFGYWLYFLAVVAVGVGGIYAMRIGAATAQPWMYNSQSTQYPPYSSQLPYSQPPYVTGDSMPPYVSQPPSYPSYGSTPYPPPTEQQYQPTELKDPPYPVGQPPTDYSPTQFRPQPNPPTGPQQGSQQLPPQQQFPPSQYPPVQ
ncbi:MAG TPA: hypothetical protein VFA41_09540 [Ktedonobacteraceae bacterium]|jgi:hypothetical protein|nr:hypothetical protein [Ktedonobacteraceae bacterium]